VLPTLAELYFGKTVCQIFELGIVAGADTGMYSPKMINLQW
jgi:hypothetical protein